MRSHQLFKKNKNLIIVLVGILFIGTSLFVISKSGNENYYSNVKNNVKNLNTSLLNNIYIAEEKEEQEITVQKENNSTDNNQKIEVKKEVEQNNIQSVVPVSTTIENNTQVDQNQTLDGVYVGLKFTGSMTAYGKDCCGSDPARQGITSSGYDLKQSLTYNDPTYGSVRIVASDKNFKLYSIVQINDPIDGSYKAIVLDRAGSVIGLNKTKKFDLAVESEAYASSNYGVHKNVSFEVLRVGR